MPARSCGSPATSSTGVRAAHTTPTFAHDAGVSPSTGVRQPSRACARRGLAGREHASRAFGPLEELFVDLESEQVWEQLELRNKPLLRYVERQLKKEQAATEWTAQDHHPPTR